MGEEIESFSYCSFCYLLLCMKVISRIDLLKKQLSIEFEMKNLVASQRTLEMDIIQDRRAEKLKLS